MTTTTNNMANMMGSFSIMTNHPGIDPKGAIKKKPVTKGQTSFLMNPEDANKQYIKGVMGTDGQKKGKKPRIVEKIDKRLEAIL
jgi:hypothetical protein